MTAHLGTASIVLGKPRVILVTGAPGSGKSTLGRELAMLLRIPFIARDDVRGGMLFSEGAWTETLNRVPTSDEAVEVFLIAVEGLLTSGVSCIVEYVVRSERPDDLTRLTAAGDCVVLMTSCDNPMDRVVQRNLTDRLIANPAVLEAVGAESVEAHTAGVVERMERVTNEMMTTFPAPTLRVETTGDYRPSVGAIVKFVTADS